MAAERRRRFGSVRVRTTAGASVIVGLALIVGAVVLVGVLRRSLYDNVETAARLRADDVVALLETGSRPEQLAVEDEESSLVQVLDERGRVLAASGNPSRVRTRSQASIPVRPERFGVCRSTMTTAPTGSLPPRRTPPTASCS